MGAVAHNVDLSLLLHAAPADHIKLCSASHHRPGGPGRARGRRPAPPRLGPDDSGTVLRPDAAAVRHKLERTQLHAEREEISQRLVLWPETAGGALGRPDRGESPQGQEEGAEASPLADGPQQSHAERVGAPAPDGGAWQTQLSLVPSGRNMYIL